MIVAWRINEQCNLACPFCAYDKTLDRSRRSADVAEVERFAGLLVEYGQFVGDSVLISWIGGEPLLSALFAADVVEQFPPAMEERVGNDLFVRWIIFRVVAQQEEIILHV